MTETRTADDFLADVVSWGDRAARHIKGLTQEQFFESAMVQDAVARCIEVVGEAAHRADRLDRSIVRDNPDFSVDRAYGARNVLSLGYNTVEPSVVWVTVTKSIPQFVAVTRRIIAQRKAKQA